MAVDTSTPQSRQKAALGKEKDEGSKARLAALEEELAQIHEEMDGMKAHWEREKEIIDRIRAEKAEIEQTRGDEERIHRVLLDLLVDRVQIDAALRIEDEPAAVAGVDVVDLDVATLDA